MRDPRAYRQRLRRELLRAPTQTVERAEWLFCEWGMGWRGAVRRALEEVEDEDGEISMTDGSAHEADRS